MGAEYSCESEFPWNRCFNSNISPPHLDGFFRYERMRTDNHNERNANGQTRVRGSLQTSPSSRSRPERIQQGQEALIGSSTRASDIVLSATRTEETVVQRRSHLLSMLYCDEQKCFAHTRCQERQGADSSSRICHPCSHALLTNGP